MKTQTILAGLLASLALGFGPSAGAAITETFTPNNVTATSTPNSAYILGNGPGLTEYITISGAAFSSIAGVQVTLDLAGNGSWDGDYYAYLRGPNGGFAVLLDRIGVTADNSYGSSASGFNVTFSDTLPNSGDIHYATSVGGGPVTGTWQTDARVASPFSSGSDLAASARSDNLGTLNGFNPNGTWTLFVADSPGDYGTLESWGLAVSGNVAVVPESSTAFAGLMALAFTLLGPALRFSRVVGQGKKPLP
jgi:hypothetical protein